MKIDVHVHTSEVSGCGQLPGAEMARLYKQAGYDAIVITDHLIAGTHRDMTPEARAEWYVSGYRAAKAEGEKIGLTVLLGAELRFFGGNEDFLLYGLTPEDVQWIFEKLDADTRLDGFYPLVRQTGRMLLIQAHPFREPLRHAPTELLDGVGAWRVHGGGFAGCVQALMPRDAFPAYRKGMEALFGHGSCRELHMTGAK